MFHDLLVQLHIHTFRQQVGLASVVIVALIAWRKGGWPEKYGGLAMLLAWFITPFTQGVRPVEGIQVGIFVIDLILLAFLIGIALKSDRFWPLWAAAFHVLGTLMHVAVVVDPSVRTRAYITAGVIFGHLTVIALLAGTLLEANRRSRLRGTA
ncbi:hypothetical protein [Caulobacter sp. NIBR2454]|uniref:hypothetical protein n=1 Tax=Caulobacter sp. NIBR2454 TaxID=3015996 RepID=UPI0022B5FE9B|nr:hypothetical protein [Caulobacter sp. NIBR2454]